MVEHDVRVVLQKFLPCSEEKLRERAIAALLGVLKDGGFEEPRPLPSPDETVVRRADKFGEKERKVLEVRHWIFSLTGQSILSLRKKGAQIWLSSKVDLPEIHKLKSRRSEVAVPKSLFLRGSSKQNFACHQKLVKKMAGEIEANLPGVVVGMGEMADWLEIAFFHLEDMRGRLFGEVNFGKEEGYPEIRSATQKPSGEFAVLGSFSPHGLHIDSAAAYEKRSNLKVSYLVYPGTI